MPLSPHEQRLWDAYPTGTLVDLTGDPDPVVRATVIAQLLLGGCPISPGHVPAVRLSGALITGCLNVSGGDVDCELRLERCVLVQEPEFGNARTRQLRFAACILPGFDGGGLRAEGYVSLSGSVIEGQVQLLRAQLLGGFRMNGTRITSQDDRFAFFSGGMTVEAGMFARDAEIIGGMRLTGSRINGGLFLQGARLVNPGRLALDGQNLVVTDAMECSAGFTSVGSVKLRNAQVNGTLSFDQAGQISNPGHLALHLAHMQISELILSPALPIEGTVSLAYSKVGVILDSEAVWPRQLRMPGLVYESLRGGAVARRIDWVSRDPEGFRPQPYEQLAAWYRRDGNDNLARRTLLHKLRARRKLLPLPTRTWSWMLDVTVGYGYRPWRSAFWFALLVTVGTFTFSQVRPHSIKQPGEQPSFNALAYTLDLLLPLSAFGQRDAFDPAGWTQWLAYGIIAAGWILATALIAGVTRVLRPN
ncbi:MAG: hypothetical protein ABIS86_16200 [Streptosporangiaceae bacterium]